MVDFQRSISEFIEIYLHKCSTFFSSFFPPTLNIFLDSSPINPSTLLSESLVHMTIHHGLLKHVKCRAACIQLGKLFPVRHVDFRGEDFCVTRQLNLLALPRHYTVKSRSAFVCCVIRYYNQLPLSIRSASSFAISRKATSSYKYSIILQLTIPYDFFHHARALASSLLPACDFTTAVACVLHLRSRVMRDFCVHSSVETTGASWQNRLYFYCSSTDFRIK